MRIIVKNLPRSTTEDEIKQFFTKKGEITDIYLLKNAKAEFRRICFIGYKSEQQAIDTQLYFNLTYFKNHKITVEVAFEDVKETIEKTETQLRKALYSKTIVIKNLGDISEDQIEQELSKFGKVLEIKLEGKLAIAIFRDGESAEKALKSLKMLAGRRIKVGNFIEKIVNLKKEHFNTLFFNFDSVINKACKTNTDKKILLDLNDKNLGSKVSALETNLVNQTKAFLYKNNINIDRIEGISKNVVIIRTADALGAIDLIKGDFGVKFSPSNNLALLVFKEEKAAEDCVKQMNMKRHRNQVIYCEFAPVCKMDPEPEIVDIKDKKMTNKVVIKNIPFQATSDDLKSLFNTYIHIIDIRLPKKPDGTHKGFGFVVMDSKQSVESFIETFGSSTHLFGRRLVLERAKS